MLAPGRAIITSQGKSLTRYRIVAPFPRPQGSLTGHKHRGTPLLERVLLLHSVSKYIE